MARIVRPWRPQGRFLRELARSASVFAACRTAGLARRTVYRWRHARIAGRVLVPDSRVLWRLLQSVQAETYGPRAAEVQAAHDRESERQAEFRRRLDAADRRVAVYEAELRARATRTNTDAGEH
ncbi:MAG: hypothetical protein PSV46_01950 [Reyranella sp.]|nr:hypothetical protein [Reyranella sp.]